MKPIPVLLDVDTGIDDALALMLALRSPALHVHAITCVGGNHRLEQVVRNTLQIVELVGGAEIPVAAGAARALIERPPAPLALHGHDGMADLALPAPALRPVESHAVELMRQILSTASTPLHLICLAPLTNLALLLRMYPALQARIGQVTIMGGTWSEAGNTSPVAEFNIRSDPEAAAIVLESGLPIRLYPLAPFRMIRFTRHQIARFLASADPVARQAGRILHFSADFFGIDDPLIADAGAVATVIDPAGVTISAHPITVELTGTATRGQTVLDRRPPAQQAQPDEWWQTSPTAVEVITAVEAERYQRLFAETLGVAL